MQEQPARPARRLLLSPALAALIVLLLAGGALAMAGRDLTWLSGIGHWLGVRHSEPGAPAPQLGIRGPRAETSAIAASPAVTSAATSTPPAPAIAPSEAPVAAARGVDRVVSYARPESRAPGAHGARSDARRSGAWSRREVAGAAGRPQRGACPAGAGAAAISGAGSGDFPVARGDASHRAGRCGNRTRDTARRSARSGSGRGSEPIVAESRSFASALERWHRDHDAAAALAALNVHERRFPSGQLGLEARLLRVEILLASGRESDALALLDHMGIAGVPRARELRTVRGELRIKLGRCADGKADLKAVLAGGTADPLAERARQAIAACP